MTHKEPLGIEITKLILETYPQIASPNSPEQLGEALADLAAVVGSACAVMMRFAGPEFAHQFVDGEFIATIHATMNDSHKHYLQMSKPN